jgi:hypothetical protein
VPLRICAAVTFGRIHLIPLSPQFIAEHAQSALATMMLYVILVNLLRIDGHL